MGYVVAVVAGFAIGFAAGYWFNVTWAIIGFLGVGGLSLAGDSLASSAVEACTAEGGDVVECLDDWTKVLVAFLVAGIVGALVGGERSGRMD